jgi:hypothetical protein
MSATIGIAGAVTGTLHGFGPAGLAAMAANGQADPAILRPAALTAIMQQGYDGPLRRQVVGNSWVC